MAYKTIKVLLDITYPDDMEDDESPSPPPGTPYALANPIDEVIKIIRDGSDGFSVESIKHDSNTQMGDIADVMFDVVSE